MAKKKKNSKKPSAPARAASSAKGKKSVRVAKKPTAPTKPKKSAVAKKAAPKPRAKPAAAGRSLPSAPAVPPRMPVSLAPLRVPDIVVPDPQEVYDESINEFEADAARESETERAPDEEPGTSTSRQSEHPSPPSHRSGKRPRAVPGRKPQDA